VVVVDTERLIPPAVSSTQAYVPEFMFDIDPADPAAGRGVGFFLRVATTSPGSLRARMVDARSGDFVDLMRVDPPDSGDASAEPRPFSASTRGALAAGTGLFWPAGPAAPPADLEYRFAFVLPDAGWGPFARLHVFQSTTDTGAPLIGGSIELVRDFFYLAVVGDSVQWGNGLQAPDKIAARVADAIEMRTDRKVIQQMLAVAGAPIAPSEFDGVCEGACFPEVPTVRSSIISQADRIERPELVDLVLLDGCINDVGLGTLLDPFTITEELIQLTEASCGDQMTALLEKVRGSAPQAPIVVLGYYQIVAAESDLLGVEAWARSRGITVFPFVGSFRDLATANSVTFREVSDAALTAVVDAANADVEAGAPVIFVRSPFGPEHALFTPESRLWGLVADSRVAYLTDLDLELFPEDPLRTFRFGMCDRATTFTSALECVYVSVGHPNPTGAREIADAIVESLQRSGVLP